MNKILEFGGEGTIILRAICDFDIYHKGDIVLYIDSTPIKLEYATTSIVKDAGITNYLGYYNYHIDTVALDGLPLSTDLLNLFQTKQTTVTYVTKREYIMAFDGELYLSNKPHDSTQIQIENFNDTITYDTEENKLVGAFIDGVTYTVYYTIECSGVVYDLENNKHIPYLNMEIHLKGNQNKQTQTIMINLPSVKMNSNPVLNIIRNDIAYYYMDFITIKNGENTQSMMIYGEE